MKVGIAKGQLFGRADERSHGVAGGSEDYKVHGICSFFPHVSKLKLQVGNLEELEASTYSRAGFRPATATAPVAQQPRVERLASSDGHLHRVAGGDRFSAAARSRDDSLRVRCHGCPV